MVPWYRKVALNMPDSGKIDDNFTALRKGLLEFAVLSTVSHSKVYAADILDKLATTPFATSEGTLYPLLSRPKARWLPCVRMGRERSRATAQILQPHCRRKTAASRTARVLERFIQKLGN